MQTRFLECKRPHVWVIRGGHEDSDANSMVSTAEKKEMKACLLQLSLSATVYDPGVSVQHAEKLLEGYDDEDIRAVMKSISSKNPWATFSGDYLDINDHAEAETRMIELRKDIY